jgi:Zn-dependent peptidase ImmA (M78 family)/DNA-binding XRE family transcriptional regulator
VLTLAEIGRRIKALREELGIPRSELATACGISEAVVEQLEAGTLDPLPGDYILIVARLLKADFRYFISEDLDADEQKTRRIYRALAKGTPGDLLAIRRFIGFCLNESELEELLGVEKRRLQMTYPAPSSRRKLHKEQGPEAARAERSRLNLELQPIANIFSIIRSQGLRLGRKKLESQSVSGLTIVHPRAGTAILVNYDEDLYRQFFSAAHEYAHALFDEHELEEKGVLVSYRFSQQDLTELRANRFAAEFLLPREAIGLYPKPLNLTSLNEVLARIARDYCVNTETAAI